MFKKVGEGQLTPESPERFFLEKDLLYRKSLVNPRKGGETQHKQLIVPLKYRVGIVERGHTGTFAAHLGITKPEQRSPQNFYWPKMEKQIKEFCQSCDIGQRQGIMVTKQKQNCALYLSFRTLSNTVV